ncbi:hypothetical protein MTO96_024491 [Rhipicephalus appendiculatus]
MPHGSGGDDLASSDEIKVFKDEGEEEKRSSENLTDLKSSLVTEGEEEKIVGLPGQATSGYASPKPTRSDAFGSLFGKSSFEPIPGPFGYVVPPYHNGALGAAVSMASKGPMVASPHPGSPLNFMVYNEPFSQPPPAHMGIPPVHIDPKTGIPRPSVYPLTSPGQYTHSMFSQEFAQQLHWHSAAAGMYPMPPMASGGFRGGSSYAPPLPRINPPLLPPSIMPHGLHPALVTPGPKQELSSPLPDTRHPLAMYHPLDSKCNQGRPSSRGDLVNGVSGLNGHEKKPQKPTNHVKKPLNAFMLYMKEMRAKVVAECTLKESAAINQILGRRWHSLSREEQSKYYEMARKERQIHMQLYPGWTARDNYAINSKKKKRKKDKSQDGDLNNPKKCRARFGLDQQSDWCKPCRRKKKCIRYQEGLDGNANESEDNIGSVEAPTPESHTSHGGGDTTTTTSTGSPCTSLGTPEPSPGPPARRADCYSLNKHHPLSVHHLTGQPLVKREPDDPVDILTPPSTDSSTTPSSLPLLTVT